MTGDTLLLRQVNPSWIQEGRITSQVFRPTPKDKKRLSVYDGDLITAEKAWKHFTNELQFASVGVMAVTVHECNAQNLPAAPDPEPFPAHAVIKFDNLSPSQIAKKAKHLKKAAETRGWQYQFEDDE